MRPYALDSDNAIELLTTIKSCEWNFDFVDPMSLSKLTKGYFDSYTSQSMCANRQQENNALPFLHLASKAPALL